MKKLPTDTSLTLVLALVTLAAFNGLSVAQPAAERAQQNLESLPELESRQTFEAGVPRRCPKPPVEYLGGVVDNFGGGNDPVTTSPPLAAFLAAHPPTRQFDGGGISKLFGHSFRMKENCKVCAVQFEVKMTAFGIAAPSGFGNDQIHIYSKTITSADLIWTAPSGSTGSGAPGTFVLSAFLPSAPSIALLNQHIFTNAPGHWLNVVAQDDHAFDYVKLRIWYY
jgi:hypothetical protein